MRGQRFIYLQLILVSLFFASVASAYNFASGTYTVSGTSSDNRPIDISDTTSPSVPDFEPGLAIVKCNAATFARWNNTGTDLTRHFAASTAAAANLIQDFLANGIELGTANDVQIVNSTCYYALFGPDGVNNDIATGSYTGNGTSQTIDISATSSPPVADFQGDLVLIKSSTTAFTAHWKSSAMPSTTGCFFAATACVTTGVTAFTSNGFTVGNHVGVNSDTITYHYAVLKATGAQFKVGSVVGTGSAGLSVTDVGFQSKFGWLKADSTAIGRLRFAAQGTGDAASPFDNGADVTNCVTSLLSNGFVLGSSTNCNASGVTTYYFMVTEISGRQRVRIVLP